MRIWRPNIWNLNPYLDQSTPGVLQQGNSNLVSEKTIRSHSPTISSPPKVLHQLDTASQLHQQQHRVGDDSGERQRHKRREEPHRQDGELWHLLQHRQDTDNESVRIHQLDDIQEHTPLHEHMGGLLRLQRPPVAPQLRMVRQPVHESGTDPAQRLADKRRDSADGQATPDCKARARGNNYYSLALRKSMLKKRLTLSLFANNFLQKERRYKNTRHGSNFTYNSDFYQSAPIGINLSLRLGELTSGVKKAMKTIENDDVKSGNGK